MIKQTTSSKPTISLITAYDQNRLIGANNQLPWQLPNDLQYFKSITLDKPVIMGRATYDSMGRALPKRHNIVMTRDPTFHLTDADCATSVEQALTLAADATEIMIIGGAQIYQLFLPLADRLYVTEVKGEFAGDTYFPLWQAADWQEISRAPQAIDERHAVPYDFVVYQRRSHTQ